MDLKAMAKSKRSHTQHHQPRKPHHPPKTTTSTTSSTVTKKDVRERKRATQAPSLPSNWGRYEDESEEVEGEEIQIISDSDEPSQVTASKSKKSGDVDAVKPKSRGADFRDLIAQAEESHTYYSPSFDDKLPDFCQGIAPMLAVRGKKIIFQDSDDDFLMEDETSGTQEVPFLTLDLEDLAERLSKIDLAKRLFIEPELLGEDANEADNQVPSQTPERRKFERVDSFGELLALYMEEERLAKGQDTVEKEGTTFPSNISSHHDQVQEAEFKADEMKSKSDDLGFLNASESVQASPVTKLVTEDESKGLEFADKTEMPQISHVKDEDTRASSRFEAAAAEAELDMLLGSFSETKIFDTPMNQPDASDSYKPGNVAITAAPLQHSLGRSAPAIPITSSLDDELDDLLAVTSNPSNNKDGVLQSTTQVTSSSSSQPSSKSKVLEDFDSWLDTL